MMPCGSDVCMHMLQMFTCITLKWRDQFKCGRHELKQKLIYNGTKIEICKKKIIFGVQHLIVQVYML